MGPQVELRSNRFAIQKNMNKVFWLSLRKDTPSRGFWDQGYLEDLLKDFEHYEVEKLPLQKFAVVIIPARSHAKEIDKINLELRNIDGVILILTGDEEGVFPIEEIRHPNIKIWVQNPQQGRHDNYTRLGTGYPPQIHEFSPKEFPEKNLDFFFAGQITHSRRMECAKQLRPLQNGKLIETKGFTQGVPHSEYYPLLASAKIAPCPSGPVTPDSFRLFEALQLGCIPIADIRTSKEDFEGFWEWLFDEPVPFTQIKNWESLPGYIEDLKKFYPAFNNRVQAWWLRYKAKMRAQLLNDTLAVGGEIINNDITVVIPASPIPSHPDTKIIDETIASVLHHLPNAEIIVTFDGVRKENEDRRANYEEHIRRFLWKYKDAKIIPYIFDEHIHQVGMMRAVIDSIKTPMILYMEHDAPVVIDYEIEWKKLSKDILSGFANVIRFHFEAVIPEEHRSLMIGKPENGLLKTVQWSQRPAICSTAYYKRIIENCFSKDAKCFIEDKMHGIILDDWQKYGIMGWNQHKLFIYYPNGLNIKRSYTTDGRNGEAKYDDSQTF